MEGGGGGDGRATLLRCTALPDTVPVHTQLSLRSRAIDLLQTSPSVAVPSAAAVLAKPTHIQALLSTMTTKTSCCVVCIYPEPERCPVLCALTPFLPSVCCSALTLCVLPCSCAPTATLSQSKLCRRRAACRAAHALRPANTGRKQRAKRAPGGFWLTDPLGAG